MTHVKAGVYETLKNGGYLDDIGEENLYTSNDDAIAGVFERLDKNICRRCTRRIFLECASVPMLDEAANTKRPG